MMDENKVEIEVDGDSGTVITDIGTIRAIVAMINEICIPKGAFDDEQLPIAQQIARELEEAIMVSVTPPPPAPWDDPNWVEEDEND